MTMSIKELQELMKLIKRNNLTEFAMKDGEFEISIKAEKEGIDLGAVQQMMPMAAPTYVQAAPAPAPVAAPAPAAPAAPAAAPAAPTEEPKTNLLEIKSPMVGTFYRKPSADKPAFVKVGDAVSTGDVVCIVEAMKLFNEIESEVSGKIVKVLVEDAQPIEYDQVLFLVEPA